MNTHRIASALLAIILSACSPAPPPPPLIDHLEDRLTALSAKKAGFGALTLEQDRLTVLTGRDGESDLWNLSDGVEAPIQHSSMKLPVRQLSDTDIADLASQIRGLIRSCKGKPYTIKVETITTTAMTTSLHCGLRADQTSLRPATTMLLNEKRLKRLTPDQSEQYWQQVLDEVRTITPRMRLHDLSTTQEQISASFTDVSNGCRPTTLRSYDASALSMICNYGPKDLVMDLSAFTGRHVAAAVRKAAESGELNSKITEVSLEPVKDGTITFSAQDDIGSRGKTTVAAPR